MDEVPPGDAQLPATSGAERLAMTNDRAGLLIIRAWIEEGSAEPLRAEIRMTTDVSAGFERTLTFSRAEAAGAAVQEWLDAMSAGAGRPGPAAVPTEVPS